METNLKYKKKMSIQIKNILKIIVFSYSKIQNCRIRRQRNPKIICTDYWGIPNPVEVLMMQKIKIESENRKYQWKMKRIGSPRISDVLSLIGWVCFHFSGFH